MPIQNVKKMKKRHRGNTVAFFIGCTVCAEAACGQHARCRVQNDSRKKARWVAGSCKQQFNRHSGSSKPRNAPHQH